MQRPEVEPECGAEPTCEVSCSGDKGKPPADSAMGTAGEETSSTRPADGGRRNAWELTDAAVAAKEAGELAREEKAARLAAASETVACVKLGGLMPLLLPNDDACQGADGREEPAQAF